MSLKSIIKRVFTRIESKRVRNAVELGELTRGRQEDSEPEVGELTRTAPQMVTRLGVVVWRKEGIAYRLGEKVPFVSKTITLDGCAALAGAFTGEVDLTDFRFHGAGTSGKSGAVNTPNLISEVGIRGVGTNVRIGERTVQSTGVVTFEDFHSIREWGLYNRHGVMFDRILTPEIVVGPGECLQFEYELTFPPGV